MECSIWHRTSVAVLWVVSWGLPQSFLFWHFSQRFSQIGIRGIWPGRPDEFFCHVKPILSRFYGVSGPIVLLWPLSLGSDVAMVGSAAVFGGVVCVKWHPHECLDPRFLHFIAMTCQWFLQLCLIGVHSIWGVTWWLLNLHTRLCLLGTDRYVFLRAYASQGD